MWSWWAGVGCLPSVVAKEQASRGDEETDHNGRGRRAGDIVGLLPAHGYRHGDGCLATSIQNGSVYYESSNLSGVVVEERGRNGPATI